VIPRHLVHVTVARQRVEHAGRHIEDRAGLQPLSDCQPVPLGHGADPNVRTGDDDGGPVSVASLQPFYEVVRKPRTTPLRRRVGRGKGKRAERCQENESETRE
jgi:hypothetical protein